MNPINPRKVSASIFTLVLSLFVLLFVQVTVNAQSYTPEETNCYNMVQGKVAWDAKGEFTTWVEGNLRKLCKGTTNASGAVSCFRAKVAAGLLWNQAIDACAAAPARSPNRALPVSATDAQSYTTEETNCYNMVQGKVAYDAGGKFTTWVEGNLRKLCKGTNYASGTVSCFRAKVSAGLLWNQAIDECTAAVASQSPNTTIGNEEDLDQRLVERGNEGPIAGVNQIQRPYFDNRSKISLISDNGMRMSRCKNCQESVPGLVPETVVLTSDPVGYYSTFEIDLVEGAKTRDTSKSVLRIDTGDTVGYCSGCVVNNIVPQVIGIMGPNYAYNRFELAQLSNGKYSLKASNGMYVGRCPGCSPSFMSRTGGFDIVAPIYKDATGILAQWSIEVVGPPYAKFPSNPNAPPTNYNPDPQGLFTKSNAQLEKDCADQTQGVVAWDRTGSKTWDKTTLTRLCRVTQNPWETIACFKLKLQESGDLETSLNSCSNSPDSPGFLKMVHARRNSGASLPPSEVPNANQPLNPNEMGLMMSWIANQVNALKTPFCWKNSFTRTGGVNPATPGGPCPAGKEKGGTTCFPPCNKPGYDGVSLACWQRCPSHTPVSCGLGCATDSSTCGWTIFDQVAGPLTIVAFAATKGGSSDKTVPVEVAANAGKMEKAIASIKSTLKAAETGLDAALLTKKGFASTEDLANLIKAGKKIQGATTSYMTRMEDLTDDFVRAFSANFAVQTSPEIERKINEKFGPRGAAEIKKQWALNQLNATLSYSLLRDIKDVLSIVSVFDPTGITATLNAYSHPICAPDADFPNLHPRFLD